MTAQNYRDAGYSVSTLIEQAAINRAEQDVINAYIVPLLGRIPTADEITNTPALQSAIMACAFLLLIQRVAVATRAGGKEKQTNQSLNPTNADLLQQNAADCASKLRALNNGVIADVDDICGIFFVSNYFYT